MTKIVVYLLIIAGFLGAVGYFGYDLYYKFYGTPKDQPGGQYSFVVEKGQGLSEVAERLEEDEVIPTKSALLFHEHFNSINSLQIGTYNLDLADTKPQEVLEQIKSESQRIAKFNAENQKPSVQITFKEGITADQVFDLLAENGVVDRQSLVDLAKNPESMASLGYEFLPSGLDCNYGNPATCAIYYLEGYFYPQTYDFFVPSTAEDVFRVFLNQFQKEVYDKIKPIDPDLLFESLIMASVIEKETGRPFTGINQDNQAEVDEERYKVASVFTNRTARGENWRSDVTASYPHNKPICQQTTDIQNCVYLDSPEALTLYNTYRTQVKVPIAPITSPTYSSIKAALDPAETNYLFFVADNKGRTYFASTNAEHEANIAKVTQINIDEGLN